jgi:hypothetical protein
VSRGHYDAQVYTNNKGHLTEQLARDVRDGTEPQVLSSAHKFERSSASEHQQIEPAFRRSASPGTLARIRGL